VSIGCCNDASKVTLTGAGLEGGALGQDLCFLIDSRRAGTGMIIITWVFTAIRIINISIMIVIILLGRILNKSHSSLIYH